MAGQIREEAERQGSRALGSALAVLGAIVLLAAVTVAVVTAVDALTSDAEGATCSELREQPERSTREARAITDELGVYDLPLHDCGRECRRNFTASVRRELTKACRDHSGDYRPRSRIESEFAD